MTSHSRVSDSDSGGDQSGAVPVDKSPDLDICEIHSERAVLTEPGNADWWIATDVTVEPPE